ncbi:SDR family NAD(P)-dependent oxidoreductase, partial [Staphylococcus sp. SIMBA_130]
MARALASCGAQVAILARSQKKIDRVVKVIEEDGGIVLGLSVNVLKKESLQDAKKKILDTFGPCDILINGAGGNH